MGEIDRKILNYLNLAGPSPITEISYKMEINYKQAKDTLARLGSNGFVIRKEVNSFLRPGRRSAQGRIGRMYSTIKLLNVITPLGRQYLQKMNKLELMINWDRHHHRHHHQ